ncbi:MAG TPA: hypothetical protein VG796_03525 [Verrucomicrobiales bacterium]|nr:hypothetical protein [Verrucomicrobiales bacterium]
MKTSLLLLLLSGKLFAGVLFDPPDGWTQSKSSQVGAASIAVAERYQSKDDSVQVTVVRGVSRDAPPDFTVAVAGTISGMKKNGYQHSTTIELTHRGFPVRHLQGEFRSPEYNGAYLADTYIVFSNAGLTTLSVMIHDAAGSRELGAGLLERVILIGEPPQSNGASGPADQHSRIYRESVQAGKYIAYGAAALLVILLIVRSLKGNNA